MKKVNYLLIVLFLEIFAVGLQAQVTHFSGPIDSCLDVFDGIQDGFTEYWQFGNNDNNNLNRYYKVVYTHPGCDTNPYQVVFRDDFDGSTLNTDYWLPNYNNVSPLDSILLCDDDGQFVDNFALPSAVSVSDGYLKLKTTRLPQTVIYNCEESPGNTITVEKKYSAGYVTTRRGAPGDQGCFKHGKFTIRAKIPNGTNNTTGAYWFFGWGGEIDVIEVCQPQCDEMQSNRHLFMQNPAQPNDFCEPGYDNMEWPEDHNIGNINQFHEYSLEWNPYKFEISVDGVVKRTFYRFNSITQTQNNEGTTTLIHPMDCDEIPTGQTDTLWQHVAWQNLYNHYMDIILNVGIKDLTSSTAGGEMQVDWVKVEQRMPTITVSRQNPGSTPDYLCIGDTAQFKASVAGNPNYPVEEWTTSSNLQIVSISPFPHQVVTVKAAGSGQVWVQARLDNQNSCYGSNIKKKFTVLGFPASPQVSVYKDCNHISLYVNNPVSSNTYQWELLTQGYYGYPFNNGLGYNISLPYLPPPYPITIAYRLLVTNECGTTTYIGAVTTSCNNWNIKVYPNPADSYVNFELENFTENDLNQNLELTLIDANFNVKKTMPVTQLLETMDVSTITPGYHYAYIVINGENVISNQFVIQH
ncbi:MAG: family 16 glycosylhydrolase [Bacteroidetes bacterium]|nr:family 16 glycosylhydrolase [Bacteroidota bacterium]